MPATKFTVTHPDGTVSTRSSKTMTYTHAVVVHDDYAISIADAERHIAYAEERLGTAIAHPERWASSPESHPKAVAMLQKDLDRLVAYRNSITEAGTWGVVGWSQTAGNAEKAAASWRRHSKGTVTVVEVDR